MTDAIFMASLVNNGIGKRNITDLRTPVPGRRRLG